MNKWCVRAKMLLTFRFIKSELTVKMCSAPRQLCGWCTHISRALEPSATQSDDAGKLLIISKKIPENDSQINDKEMNNKHTQLFVIT